MRIWSLHPRYLDQKGLVACWRETLLAQKVLAVGTTGYRSHPQLERFRAAADPLAAIGSYLHGIHAESLERGYRFDAAKILTAGDSDRLDVTAGQLRYEAGHLRGKLLDRDPGRVADLPEDPEPHPLFRVIPGDVESWEKR